MGLNDLLAIIIIPFVLALLGILWPEIQRFWRGRAMEALILRELSEIGLHPKDRADQEDWYKHQKKRFVHRVVFDKPEQHLELLLSIDSNLVYFVTLAWNSLDDHDWKQWEHALQELSKRYDADKRLKKHGRQGKIGHALEAWRGVYKLYHSDSPSPSPVA